ncbi:MAG: dihydrolipoyl dehydrogenase [Anaerolineae bacterium]
MSITTTQLVIIGGGPGGYAAAFLAADLGMQVTLIDLAPNPGGVCLYRGCIPSKALLHAARLITDAEEAAAWGLAFGKPQIDLDKLRGWKEGVVSRLTGGLGQLSKQRKINFIQGRARFLDPRTVEVATAEEGKRAVVFEHAILATGSRPAAIPALTLDSPRVMDSTAALALAEIPGSLLVVGGGYIGLELGSVYAALGSRVTVVEMMPGLLPGADRDLVRVLAKRLAGRMQAIRLNTTVTGMEEADGGVRVQFEGADAPQTAQMFERVLVSVGRRPNTDGLGLEKTRVQLDERGFVRVDPQRRTAEPAIFAIGDIAGEPMLAHKASTEGKTAVEAIAGRNAVFEPQAIPAVVFTDPELAWCGLTETQAKADGRKVTVARFPWGASGRAVTLARAEGLTKLLLDPETERVLGVGIAGAGAGELIAEGALAVEMAALAADLRYTVHPHPTLSETIMESADVFFGQSTHLYRPKRK